MPVDMVTTKQKFYTVAGFPNVIGAIDCTHIGITNLPKETEHIYVNRKR